MFAPKIELDSSLKVIKCHEAQPWCNFVLFETTWLPEGMKIAEGQLRPESAAERSTYRCLITDLNRKLSIKQFLYDWAPPAYDHPSLWRNSKISPIDETPIPRSFHVNSDIAWIGLNFRRQPALSLSIQKTMIEMTAVEGIFTDDELIAICRGLKPADLQIRDRILSTPFSYLCYSNRHSKAASDVPLSYWKYTRQKTWSMNSMPISHALQPIQIPSSYGYSLNSVFVLGDPIQETEYYYEHRDLPGSYIRLLVSPYGQKNGIPYPPRLGDQVCRNRKIRLGDTEIYHAYLAEEVGPHEAVWRHQNSTILLLSKPAKHTSLTWFDQLLNDLIVNQIK